MSRHFCASFGVRSVFCPWLKTLFYHSISHGWNTDETRIKARMILAHARILTGFVCSTSEPPLTHPTVPSICNSISLFISTAVLQRQSFTKAR